MQFSSCRCLSCLCVQMFAASSWEGRDYSALEADDYVGNESDVESDHEPSAEECSQMFLDLLVSLKMSGKMFAKTACLLAYWAKGGGLSGAGTSLAMSPGRTGGVYSAHFDKVIGLDEKMKQDWYKLKIPAHCRYDASRMVKDVASSPAHESIADELAESPGILARLRETVAASEWCENYTQHPLVKSEPAGSVLPLGIYIDGVKYHSRDSTIGFWAINLLTSRRHLLACLPKRELCRCGCHGWCSLFPVLAFVEWTFAAMVAGFYPQEAHDGPWKLGSIRAGQSGESLGFRGVPIILKGDWAEFAGTLGFRSWMHHAHPCFRCFATAGEGGSLSRTTGISVLDAPWQKKTMDDYEQACADAEIVVTVRNARQLGQIVDNLSYDKRRVGGAGRCLTQDLPTFLLKKGERLEPSLESPNVAAVDSRTDFPFELVFWRISSEGLCRHRCPIFSRRSGITPESICIDELHTLHLGVFQDYIGAVVWALFDTDVWNMREGLTDDSYHQKAALRLKAELFAWYRKTRKLNPEKPLYQMGDLQLTMLGTRDKPGISAKAAESGTLLAFAFDLAKLYRLVLPHGSALVGAGEALMKYMEVTRSSELRLSTSARQNLADAIVRFVTLRESAGVLFKPKCHLMVHMLEDALKFGNPRCTGTWLDEGLNAQLAAVCRSAHMSVWTTRILASFAHHAGPAAMAAQVASKRQKLRS
jgi:hypothetical protein